MAETITVRVRSTARNRTGGTTTTSERLLAGCLFAPTGSSEEYERREEVTATGQLFVPPAHGIVSTDEIVLPDDTVWQVNGTSEDWTTGWTDWQPGSVIPLQRTEG